MKIYKSLMSAIVTMLVSVSNAGAQIDKKTVIRVDDVTYSSPFTEMDAQMIRNKIIVAINNTRRVRVVDNSSSIQNLLYAESERRKRESAMDGNTVADMTTINADSRLSIELKSMQITPKVQKDTKSVIDSDGKPKQVVAREYTYYDAELIYNVTITDCESGKEQGREVFFVEDGGVSFKDGPEYTSEEDAHNGIIRVTYPDLLINRLILNTFKAHGKILQADEGDAKKAKTVFIDLGSSDGVNESHFFDVYKETNNTRELIGEIEVIEILSASRCLAKVKKGGDAIQYVLSTGGNPLVISKDVKI